MPLVNDLHNKAMRERHWVQIKVFVLKYLTSKLKLSILCFQNESNKHFDENSDEFTLEAIVELHFEENAALINEFSEAASKEYDIEKVIFGYYFLFNSISFYS
jgi:hypothetical protein